MKPKVDFRDIKVILFDIDNTLLDFRKCAKGAMKKAFAKWNIPFKDEYLPAFLQINNKYWNRYEKGEITREYLYQNRWAEIFDTLGIDCPGAEFEKDFIANLYESCDKVDNVSDVLAYLKNKYDLFIASNSSYDEQTGRLNKAGLLNFFKKVYTSEEIGHAKPSQEFFDYIYQDLDADFKKDEILIIGDSLNADIKGGKDYGLKTAWFDYENTNEENPADYRLTELAELKDIL